MSVCNLGQLNLIIRGLLGLDGSMVRALLSDILVKVLAYEFSNF